MNATHDVRCGGRGRGTLSIAMGLLLTLAGCMAVSPNGAADSDSTENSTSPFDSTSLADATRLPDYPSTDRGTLVQAPVEGGGSRPTFDPPGQRDTDPTDDERRIDGPDDGKDAPRLANSLQVKFRESSKVRLRETPDGLRPVAVRGTALRTTEARHLLTDVAGGRWRRLHTAEEEVLQQVYDDQRTRYGRSGYVPDLNNWFILDLPETLSAETVAGTFRRLEEVQYARVQSMPTPLPAAAPDFMDPDSDFAPTYQGYHLPVAEGGVDAQYAWTRKDGDGRGVKVCTVEYDAQRDHADLDDGDPVELIFAEPMYSTGTDRDHGTAVLGIVGGRDNGFGVKGIAYRADLALSSSRNVAQPGTWNIAAAVVQAMLGTDNGDVILVEQQENGPNRPADPADDDDTGLVPAEWDLAVFDAIRVATLSGRVVVEAAGNGTQDLDGNDYRVNNGGHYPFDTDGQGNYTKDSGAILVGAGFSPFTLDAAGNTFERVRVSSSNFGIRVDVQCWGDSIVTTGGGDNARYYDGTAYRLFSGTSGATAMIGGVAAGLQGIAKDRLKRPLRSEELRDLLKATGLPEVTLTNWDAGVGPHPNMRMAADAIDGHLPAPVLSPLPQPGDVVSSSSPKIVTIDLDPSLNPDYVVLAYTVDGENPDITNGIGYENGGVGWVIEPGDSISLTEPTLLTVRAFLPEQERGGVFRKRIVSGSLAGAYYGLYIPAPTADVQDFSGTPFVYLAHNLGEEYHLYEHHGILKPVFVIVYTLDGSDPDPDAVNAWYDGPTQALGVSESNGDYVDVFANTDATSVTVKARTVVGVGTAAWAVGEMTVLQVSR